MVVYKNLGYKDNKEKLFINILKKGMERFD